MSKEYATSFAAKVHAHILTSYPQYDDQSPSCIIYVNYARSTKYHTSSGYKSESTLMYIDAGSKDLLTLMGVTSLPLGVRRARDRQSAYVVDHTSSINAPLSKVVRVFPAEFALLITARQRTTGFLFTVNDMLGCVQLSEFFLRHLQVAIFHVNQTVIHYLALCILLKNSCNDKL